MSFASRYLQHNINYPAFIFDQPSSKLGMVVVIPCYDEPAVVETIESLASCKRPLQDVEVLVVVNQSEKSAPTVETQNKRTILELKQWKTENPTALFNLHVMVPEPFRKKHAGAGLARKTGMDEAIRRFASLEKPDGLIISLDADTLVETNYLVEIENHFASKKNEVGTTIKFKHRVDELVDPLHIEGMQLYEDYLHYYKKAMASIGFPHAIYTVGSAFAVCADAYVKQGGMNRRQAGEDFYFLHKLTAMGSISELNTTCVYPSARLSNRVPFGTGPSIHKWVNGDKSLSKTYAFQAFLDLKQLFDLVPELYESELESFTLPASVQQFLTEDCFSDDLAEIRRNSGSPQTFQKRFFQYFNAFKILKYLNAVHPTFYDFQKLKEAYTELKGH
jgi:glycosyltransferase involved in cell wall biosynthesis